MTIIFFSRLFYPHIGGVEKHVLEVGKRLVRKGYKVIIITEKLSNFNKLEDKIEGIEIIRIKVGKENKFKKFRIWLSLFGKFNLIKKADIIHCHDIFFWYLPLRFIFPLKHVYVTFHGYEGNLIPTKKAILMHKIAEELSLGNICIGNFYKRWYGTKATIIKYGAVDLDIIKKHQRKIKPNKDIIFIGRLEDETGIMEYLKAMSILKTKGINMSMDVFGDGLLKDKAIKYASVNNLKVNFKGFLPEAASYIENYKYVFTSRYLGILEAIVLKKPVFSEYNNEIKKDYLLMSPFSRFISISRDGGEISKNFENYLKNKNTLDIEKAYNWVINQTWDNMVDAYLRLWFKNS